MKDEKILYLKYVYSFLLKKIHTCFCQEDSILIMMLKAFILPYRLRYNVHMCVTCYSTNHILYTEIIYWD